TVSDCFLERIETQLHLLTHVARTGPAHERLDLARLFGLVVEHPFLGLGGAGLHCRLRGLVDAGGHGCLLASEQRNLVGAAGFEPATWSTQNSRATRLRYAPSLSGWPRYTLRFAPASRAGFADVTAAFAERAFSDSSVR